MDHRPQAWGRPRDDVYGAYDTAYLHGGPKQMTQTPIVTGTSVVAIKFKDGVVMAADNLASYGSLARFTKVPRLRPFLASTIVGFSGDVSDMQFLDRLLAEIALDESYEADAVGQLNAANLHAYLRKLMYRRRNDMDPLWNQVLIGGLDGGGRPFLSQVDLRGTAFSAPALATGYGAMLATPVMRRFIETDADAALLSRDKAVEIVKECVKVLFYRDARSMDRYSIAVVTADGVELKEDEQLEKQSWAFAETIRGYGTQTV